MKTFLKKCLYVIPYVIYVYIGVYCDMNLNLAVKFIANPFIFLIFDITYLVVIIKLLAKENVRFRSSILVYFKTVNQIFLIMAVLLSQATILMAILYCVINYILILLLSPPTSEWDMVNGTEAFYDKHPEKKKSRYYHSNEQIKNDYEPIKKEVEEEIVTLDKDVKKDKLDKRVTVISYVTLVTTVVLLFVGLFLSGIEGTKKFNRGHWHHFSATINGEELPIGYYQNYERTVIPIFYVQRDERAFDDSNSSNTSIVENQKYIFKLHEYECFNNDKKKMVAVACGVNATNETLKEVKLSKSTMEITYENRVIYDGEYKSDITDYLTGPGRYNFTIINNGDYIVNKIYFSIDLEN